MLSCMESEKKKKEKRKPPKFAFSFGHVWRHVTVSIFLLGDNGPAYEFTKGGRHIHVATEISQLCEF